jgi:hypothetical protein
MIQALAVSVLAAIAQPPALTWDGSLPDRDDPKAVVDFIVKPRRDLWVEGLPEAKQMVRDDPARFAPEVRDRLMRVPATFDEYSVNDPRWVISRQEAYNFGVPAEVILSVVELLGREHAEPILQEFFDKVNPLALEAQRRRWLAVDAYRAGEDGADELVREAGEIRVAISSARGQTLQTALRLESPIFVDDITAMMFRNDPAERVDGAGLAAYYIPHFAAERPDAVAKVRAGAASLFASENPRVANAGRRLMERLDKELGPEPTPDGPLPPAPDETGVRN